MKKPTESEGEFFQNSYRQLNNYSISSNFNSLTHNFSEIWPIKVEK